MTAIDYAYGEQLARVTHTGDTLFVDTGAEIPDADITDGANYALIVTSQNGYSSANSFYSIRVVQGTAPAVMVGSNFFQEPSDVGLRHNYVYVFNFTASEVAGENIIKVQMRADDFSLTVEMATIQMLAINLDDLDSNDWEYGQSVVSTDLTTSFVDFASITFTPANNNNDWLVIGCGGWTVDDVTVNTQVRLRRDGTEVAPADSAPLFSEEGERATEMRKYGFCRGFTLDDSEHTFAIQMRDDAPKADQNDHEFSSLIAINMNAFQNHAFSWNEDEQALGAPNVWEEALAVTPNIQPIASDMFVFGSCSSDNAVSGSRLRIQLGGTTTPVGRDTADGRFDAFSFDTTDENAMFTMALLLGQSEEQDLDLDALVAVTATQKIEDRSFVAFTAELVAVPANAPKFGQPINQTLANRPGFGQREERVA